MAALLEIFWILFLIHISHSQSIRPEVVTMDEINFDELIDDILETAQESQNNHRHIFKIYNRVFGPVEEMFGIHIGEVVIECDPDLPHIVIYKYNEGHLCIEIDVNNKNHHARIHEVVEVEDGLNMKTLMKLINMLLSKLKVNIGMLSDTGLISYEGCGGKNELIPLLDLNAIQGHQAWYIDAGYRNDVNNKM